MQMITVSGPPSAGKTSVILKAAACLRAQGHAVGIVKFDCLLSDDDQLYAASCAPITFSSATLRTLTHGANAAGSII